MRNWVKLDIQDAIRASRSIILLNENCIKLLAGFFWCPETHNFIFPWAEVTEYLEDSHCMLSLPS